jgi:hypothetical protein
VRRGLLCSVSRFRAKVVLPRQGRPTIR